MCYNIINTFPKKELKFPRKNLQDKILEKEPVKTQDNFKLQDNDDNQLSNLSSDEENSKFADAEEESQEYEKNSSDMDTSSLSTEDDSDFGTQKNYDEDGKTECALSIIHMPNTIYNKKNDKYIAEKQIKFQVNHEERDSESHKLFFKLNQDISHKISSLKKQDDINLFDDKNLENMNQLDELYDIQDNFYDKIKSLPVLESVLFPVSIKTAHSLQFLLEDDRSPDWSPFGQERSRELQKFENSIIGYQLKTNNLDHAWKTLYTEINKQCNVLGIPYKFRNKMFIKELEYLSLIMHDVLPYNYQEQGIFPQDKSISSYKIFFSEDDSLSVARKKWLTFLNEDYEFFWDAFSGRLPLYQLSDYDVVKLQDLLEIIWFINPKGVQKLLSTIRGIRDVQYVHQKSSAMKYYVHSRHKGYYLWMVFGW